MANGNFCEKEAQLPMKSSCFSMDSPGRRDGMRSSQHGDLWTSWSRMAKGTGTDTPLSITASQLLVLLLMVLFAAGHFIAPPSSCAQQTKKSNRASKPANEVLEEFVLKFTNTERRERGLPPLKLSPALRFVARKHSSNMCGSGVFEHEDSRFPEGWATFDERLGRVGLASGGENIGYRTLERDVKSWARAAVNGWMRSESHRRNILDPRFRYLGVGIRPCKDGVGYATQVFSPSPGNGP